MTSKPQLAQLPAQADMHTAGVCLFARLRGCVQMSLPRVPWNTAEALTRELPGRERIGGPRFGRVWSWPVSKLAAVCSRLFTTRNNSQTLCFSV